jgi:hypothetical protein
MADLVGRRVDPAWVIRMGGWGARALALVLVLALLFTMVNVQTFAAAGHPVESFQWWIAWLLDPMASITMGTAIVFEGLLADYGRRVGWLTATKWYAGGCTWAMNIWVSLTSGSLAGVLLHSVAPGLVLLLAEAAPRVRQHLAEIVHDLREQEVGRPAQAQKPAAGSSTPVELPAATYRRVPPPQTTGEPPPQALPGDVAPVSAPPTAPPGPVDPEPVTSQDPLTPVSVTAPPRVETSRVPAPVSSGAAGDDELVKRVRQLVADSDAAGRKVGRRLVAKQFDISEHRARGLLDLVTANVSGSALNGTSGSGRAGAGRGDR